MIGLNFRSLTFMLFIFCLTWSSHIHTCKARRGKHWRHRRGSSVSLYNRNGKNHGSSNHQSNVGKMISPPTPEHRAPPSLQKATMPPPYPNTLSPPPTPPPPSTPLLAPNAPPPLPPYPNVPPPPQSPNAPPPSPNMPQPPPSLSTSPSPPYPNTPPQLQIPNAPPPPPSLNALPPPSYPNTSTPPQPPYPNAPLPLPYSNAPAPPPPPSLTAPSPPSYPNAPLPPSPNASKPLPSPNAPPPPNAPTCPPPSPNVPPPPPSLNAPPPPSYPNTPPPSPYSNAPQPPPSPNAPPPPPYPNTPPAPPPPSSNEPPPPSYLNTPPPPPPSRNAPQPPPPPNSPPPPLPPPPSPVPPPQPPPSSPKPPPLPTSVKPPPLSKAPPLKVPPPPKAPPPPPSPKPPPRPKAPPPSLKAPKPSIPQPSIVFDVVKFGARGDGASDDTKAFQSAWAAACKVEASTIMVPSEFTFLVGPISFAGPNCQPNIIFQLDGTIIAPTSSKPWGSGLLQWIEFTKLKGITVQGSGTIDGRGSVWWKESPYAAPPDKESRLAIPLNKVEENPPISSNSLGGKMPSTKPTALRFYGSSNAIVKGITIQNSPLCHLKFDNCLGVSVFNISISSPGDSPNTDGIHLQNSQNVLIRSTNLSCGDDCVSIQTGCSNVDIHNVNCGPGHGISIGGLGKDQTKACVSNITVRDTNMHNTLTGVRIKTWQGGSGSVQGVLFSNIQVSEVKIPIVIDQYYCHSSKCKNQTSAVALSDIRYEKISGTYTVQPAYLACSDSIPCVDVILSDIGLNPLQQKYRMDDAFCWKTFGESKAPVEPPIHCIQHRKQSRNWIQKDQYSCQA